MKTAIVLGTRPEIIKMSPIIKECQRRDIDFYVIHTGQHYSYNMDRVFFEELGLPDPDYHLDVGSGSHGEQTGKMLSKIESVLLKEKTDVLLVQGDTNSVLAGSLAASKMDVKLGHVEAGLRSFDRAMPEEINRVVSDHVSDYLFAPTEVSKGYLLDEGIPKCKIHVVGNTVVDAVFNNLDLSKSRKGVFVSELGYEKGSYFLVTVHRAENVDDRDRFCKIIESLDTLAELHGVDMLYPIHPRSKKNLEAFGIVSEHVKFYEPFGYLEFLQLISNAKMILTDSGGIQEEACILGVPCITLRDKTERPETVEVGSNIVAGVNYTEIHASVGQMLEKDNNWRTPYGDGDTAGRILNILENELK